MLRPAPPNLDLQTPVNAEGQVAPSVPPTSPTLAEYFADRPDARAIFDRVHAGIRGVGSASVQISRSQIGFRRKRLFAATWIPDRYLHGNHAPLVLTLFFRRREPSERWKEVVQASPGHFTHHLELNASDEVDDDVRELIRRAWEEAG
jgi:hypothetical protein